jgi:hypothetical protein
MRGATARTVPAGYQAGTRGAYTAAWFDEATGVIGGNGRYAVTVDPEWTVGGNPHGGYPVAILARGDRWAGRGCVPVPGPVRVRQRVRVLAGDFVDQVTEVWGSTDRVVAQATQLAAVRIGR